MRDRVALVTGANRGIGKEVVGQLAHRGVTVLLGCRDTERGAETAREFADASLDVVPLIVDVTEAATVIAAATAIERAHGRLDILVNNAGCFVGATPLATTAAQMSDMFAVNVFGVVTMIRTLMPLLQLSKEPRIVNVSSATASLELASRGASLPGDGERRLAYSCSKAALNMLTLQYAQAFSQDPELRHIRINSASPGYTATGMNNYSGDRTVEDAARIIIDLATLPENGPSGGFFDDQGLIPW